MSGRDGRLNPKPNDRKKQPEPYPEHEKLAKIAPLSQAIGEFLDDMESRGIYLSDVDDFGRYRTVNWRRLLAEHFDIDEDLIEREKRAMLERMRENNA